MNRIEEIRAGHSGCWNKDGPNFQFQIDIADLLTEIDRLNEANETLQRHLDKADNRLAEAYEEIGVWNKEADNEEKAERTE